MYNIFNYLTTWSLLINFSIFIWSFIVRIPFWLFLMCASLLTVTSILGTFYITIPLIDKHSHDYEITKKKVILLDTFIHTGPLIVLFLFYYKLKNNTYGKSNLLKTLFGIIIITIFYMSYTKGNIIYEYDGFTLFVISFSLFLSSYYVYLRI